MVLVGFGNTNMVVSGGGANKNVNAVCPTRPTARPCRRRRRFGNDSRGLMPYCCWYLCQQWSLMFDFGRSAADVCWLTVQVVDEYGTIEHS